MNIKIVKVVDLFPHHSQGALFSPREIAQAGARKGFQPIPTARVLQATGLLRQAAPLERPVLLVTNTPVVKETPRLTVWVDCDGKVLRENQSRYVAKLHDAAFLTDEPAATGS